MNYENLETVLLHLYQNKKYHSLLELHILLGQTLDMSEINEVLILIQKLIKDGYVEVEIQKSYSDTHGGHLPAKDKELYFITFDGVLFAEKATGEYKDKPYQYANKIREKKESDERTERWPKKYWPWVLIGTFILGGMFDIGKEVLRRKILPESTLSTPSTLGNTDSLNRR